MDSHIIISGKRQRLIDLLPLKKPLSIFLEPTNICNFRCVMCVHGTENTRNDLKPFQDMDMNLYRRIIRELADWEGPPLKLLRLTMLGEPLLNKNIIEMIRFAKEAKVAECIDFFTNASMLTPEMSEKLVKSGVDRIRFSIYAVDEERHAKITVQNKFTPSVIHNNIKFLWRIREKLKSKTPYMLVKMFDAFGKENELFFSMYKDISDEVDLERVHNATRYSGNNLIKMFYNDPILEKKTEESYKAGLHELKSCPRPFMALCVDSIGNVLMCTHDAARGTKIADLNNTTLKDVWYGEPLFQFRKMQLEGKLADNRICANCSWFKLFPQEDCVDGFSIERWKD